jgi:hypothetical protein
MGHDETRWAYRTIRERIRRAKRVDGSNATDSSLAGELHAKMR